MSSFDDSYIKKIQIHPSIVWSTNLIAEAKGQQSLWQKTRPDIIQKLQESALVQSAESSNRIEGVEVDKKRLVPLVLGLSKPLDRSEEEIVGYRKALNWIHKNYGNLDIDSKTILKLHKICQGGMISNAGQFKSKDNEIIEFSQFGDRRVRFRCVTAERTPEAIRNLCQRFLDIEEKKHFPEILNVANFIFDFLCIHPFRDGNGRVSRLLTLLCLYKINYHIGRYISLEKIIEQSKTEYYEALAESSKDWHTSRHNLFPWWSFFLSHIKEGYQDLKTRVELSTEGDSISSLLKQQIASMDDGFKISDILNLNPAVDREIVKKVLVSLKKEKIIKIIGSGKASRWKII
jgi:Fic family protein